MGFSRQEYWSGLPFPSPTIVQFKIKQNKKTPPVKWLKTKVLKIFHISTYNFFFTSYILSKRRGWSGRKVRKLNLWAPPGRFPCCHIWASLGTRIKEIWLQNGRDVWEGGSSSVCTRYCEARLGPARLPALTFRSCTWVIINMGRLGAISPAWADDSGA